MPIIVELEQHLILPAPSVRSLHLCVQSDSFAKPALNLESSIQQMFDVDDGLCVKAKLCLKKIHRLQTRSLTCQYKDVLVYTANCLYIYKWNNCYGLQMCTLNAQCSLCNLIMVRARDPIAARELPPKQAMSREVRS